MTLNLATSFLLWDFVLLDCGVLDFSYDCLLSGLYCWGVEGLPAVVLDGPEWAILDTLFKEGSCDGADNFVLLDQDWRGDVLSKFGDTWNVFIIGSLIEEDGIISFFFNFTLVPFLNQHWGTLVVPLAWEAALEMASLLFFCPATGCFPICGYKLNNILIKIIYLILNHHSQRNRQACSCFVSSNEPPYHSIRLPANFPRFPS